ncbi:hypothetical protein B0J18DRAFT_97011 [Chaetomium sp. MPI-SDFR-AT-0129]|nr:hypothetical protein B0J18DRAFT_97011 [Chaetomium sp. MPI-SDFR-AT-0129]
MSPIARLAIRTAGRAPPNRAFGIASVNLMNPTMPSRFRAVSAFHTFPALLQQNGNGNGNGGKKNIAPGAFARTDDSITVEYPPEEQLPSSEPVEGTDRAGAHIFPTLATFSLQGKVGVVTGGARGLGLVMGREYILFPFFPDLAPVFICFFQLSFILAFFYAGFLVFQFFFIPVFSFAGFLLCRFSCIPVILYSGYLLFWLSFIPAFSFSSFLLYRFSCIPAFLSAGFLFPVYRDIMFKTFADKFS